MPVRAGLLYAVDGGGPNPNANLVLLDPVSGVVVTVVGPIGFVVGGMAFDPQTGILYATTGGTGPNPGNLIKIDINTGRGSLIGNLGLRSGTLADLAFAPSGILYGWAGPAGGSALYKVDLTTGAATWVGDSGIFTRGGGLAADAQGRLFLAGSAAGALYRVDPSTGAATAGPTLTGAPIPSGVIKALDFDETGTLFGLNFAGADGDAFLVTIDPTTGVVTPRGDPIPRLDALAFWPTGVVLVPEPSALLLVGTGAALLVVGRRRRLTV